MASLEGSNPDTGGIHLALNPEKKVAAVILAGESRQNIYPDESVPNRAMVPIAGKPAIEWIIGALRASQIVGKIVVVGAIRVEGVDLAVKPVENGSFLESLMAGLDAVPEEEEVLVCTSDIPLITPEGIADFVRKARSTGARLALPIIEKSHCVAKYPQLKRTYATLREGTFTLGNVALVDSAFLRQNREMVRRTFAMRKSPLKLAGLIGFGIVFRFALSKLVSPKLMPLAMLEEAVSKLLGGSVKAVRSEYAELGEDMDRPGDIELFESILQRSQP